MTTKRVPVAVTVLAASGAPQVPRNRRESRASIFSGTI